MIASAAVTIGLQSHINLTGLLATRKQTHTHTHTVWEWFNNGGWLMRLNVFNIFYVLSPYCGHVHACTHFCVCVYFLFHYLRITAQNFSSSGGFRPASQPQQQYHRSLHKTCPVPSEQWDHDDGCEIVPFGEGFRFLLSRPSGHSLCLHLRTSQPLPPLPASFAEYSFCFVQVVAGGGGGVVR